MDVRGTRVQVMDDLDDRERGNAPYDRVPLEDIEGTARPQGSRTDMGCYETE